jgi:ligand-binding sensor domain-containing protein/GAF domain-containing protein
MDSLRFARWFAIFLALVLVVEKTARAQEEKQFKLYTAIDGLSDDNVNGIAQDRYGYIWAGTSHGLNRYDGKHFAQFHTDTSKQSLPDEGITNLVWLDKDRLAAYTGMGLHIINTQTGATSNIIIPAPDNKFLYKFNSVMSVLAGEQGNIYMITRSGFYHYDRQGKLIFRFDYYTREETTTVPFEFGSNLLWLSPNEIVAVTINGRYIYNIQARRLDKEMPGHTVFSGVKVNNDYLVRQTKPGVFLFINIPNDTIVYADNRAGKKIVTVIKAHNFDNEFNWRSRLRRINDSLYYLTSRKNGFFKVHINEASGKVTIDPKRFLDGYLCSGFLIGSDNRVWVATNAGLLKEVTNNTSVRLVTMPPTIMKQTPDLRIRELFCYDNKLFAACIGNGGLQVLDKNSLSFLYKVDLSKYFRSPEAIYSIIEANDDTLFVGTNGPLIWLKASTGETGQVPLDGWDKAHNWISAQYKDSRGNIWVCTEDNTKIYFMPAGEHRFRRLNYNYGVFRKILVAFGITEDRSGNIWMCGHGVCRINRITGQPDLYMDSFPYTRFPRREVSTMLFDSENMLWTGLNTNGLAGYNMETKKFLHFSSKDGLPDNYVKALRQVGNKLWVTTTTGLAALDLSTYKISNFSADDGFPALPATNDSFFYDSVGHKLYCGFTNQLVRFDPDSLMHTSAPPPFFIESINLLNGPTLYHPGKSIKVPYNSNDITVTVGSINYNDVSNQRIAYRILDSDDTLWKPLTGYLINFNNLPPGNYRIHVRLYAANDRWPAQIKEILIMITPPFWGNYWFIALMALLLLSLAYIIYRSKVNAVRKKERAKAQLQELKAEEYKNRLELEKISHYFSSSLSGKNSINEVLWDVARNLIGRMGYMDCMIYMWNEDKTKMVQKAGYGFKGTPEAIAEKVFDVLPGQGVVGYVMQTRRPVLIADTRKDKRYRPDDIFRLSEVSVPIIHNDELMGVINSEHEMPNYYKERDLKMLTTIATLVGNKLKQVESERSLAMKRAELAHINQQLAEAQLTALQTQMNPHFIFNALNSIKRMILDNENQNASRYLSKFAQMIRLTLNHSKETFVTLQETIEYLHAYLDMEQLRFGSSFSYNVETTGKTDEDINIPTLMIQPLAENAIWHGLMNRKGDKKIVIRFLQDSDMVTCTIEDNGIGIRAAEKMTHVGKQPPVGLDNLRNRIKIMNEKYCMNCTLDIIDLKERDIERTGTLVVLKFKALTW